MLTDDVITPMDFNSSTIMFNSIDTPSEAYSKLTDAVYNAFSYDDITMVDIDNLPRDTTVGEVTYDEEKEEVVELELWDWVIEEHGF